MFLGSFREVQEMHILSHKDKLIYTSYCLGFGISHMNTNDNWFAQEVSRCKYKCINSVSMELIPLYLSETF